MDVVEGDLATLQRDGHVADGVTRMKFLVKPRPIFLGCSSLRTFRRCFVVPARWMSEPLKWSYPDACGQICGMLVLVY